MSCTTLSAIDTRRSLNPARKAIERPSGDQNIRRSPEVPDSLRESCESSDRTDIAPASANAICLPSGDTAVSINLLVVGVAKENRLSGGMGVTPDFLDAITHSSATAIARAHAKTTA
jgi:hypothetical protein